LETFGVTIQVLNTQRENVTKGFTCMGRKTQGRELGRNVATDGECTYRSAHLPHITRLGREIICIVSKLILLRQPLGGDYRRVEDTVACASTGTGLGESRRCH